MFRVLIIGIFLSFALVLPVVAQDKGKVTVIKDPQIDSLIARRLSLSHSPNAGGAVSGSGFRVQIFSGLDREAAYAEQTKFKSLYPTVPTYISYTQPNYRVRVGDFHTRMEAQRF